jgi:flagellar motility protein MotE (MotC chaperone)
MSAEADTLQAEVRARAQAEALARSGMPTRGGKIVVGSGKSVSVGLRVLPLVIIALTGLLSFKLIGIVNSGGYAFPFGDGSKEHPFANFGQLLAGWRPHPVADPIVTGSLGGKKPADEAKAAGDKPAMDGKPAMDDKPTEMAQADGEMKPKMADAMANDTQPADAKPADAKDAMAADGTSPLAGAAAQSNAVPAAPMSETERALMLRLQTRRETLEKRGQEMDLREGLLAAAEKRLEDRIKDLSVAEDGGDMPMDAPAAIPGAPADPSQPAMVKPRRNEPRQAIKNLVTVYETMRPKDAARVFETLEQPVLIEVVKQIAPRKMAEIMASMTPDAAAKLTVALASDTGSKPHSAAMDASGLPAGELQRLPAAKVTPATP